MASGFSIFDSLRVFGFWFSRVLRFFGGGFEVEFWVYKIRGCVIYEVLHVYVGFSLVLIVSGGILPHKRDTLI